MLEADGTNTIVLSGAPETGSVYKLRAEMTDDQDRLSEVRIPVDVLIKWLLTKGCEFGAHQVKLGLSVRCGHIHLTEIELAGLGL